MAVSAPLDVRGAALASAQRLARRLLDPDVPHDPHRDVHHAVSLIHDYVHYLDQPALAIAFALEFHATVERWSEWATWSGALDTLLALEQLDPTETMHLLLFRSRAAQRLGDYTGAISNATSAFEFATVHHDVPLTASILNQLSAIAFEQDDYFLAKSYMQKIEILDKTNLSLLEFSRINLNLGNVSVQQANFHDAHHYYEQAMDDYQKQRDNVGAAKVKANLSDLYRREGRLPEALATIQDALCTFKMEGACYSYALAQNDLGCIYLQTQQWAEALDTFTCALKELEHLGALGTKAWILTNVVELYIKLRRWTDAENAAAEGYELASICNKPLVTASTLR